jgi:hypothetical protein
MAECKIFKSDVFPLPLSPKKMFKSRFNLVAYSSFRPARPAMENSTTWDIKKSPGEALRKRKPLNAAYLK